jgi:ABC-type antimicrobial peptide transport system permease subunit
MAEKYFGKEDPIGKTIRMQNKYENIVTAVIKNYPINSNLKFDFLIPFSFFKDFYSIDLESWGWNSHSTFVLLKNNVSLPELEEKIAVERKKTRPDSNTDFYLFPLSKVHLYQIDPSQISFLSIVKLVTIVGIFILLIACINFMNLSTARSANRAKEVGIRKVTGSHRIQLILQFFGESFLFSFFGLIIAIILTLIFLPVFNQLSDKQLVFNFTKSALLIWLIGITLVVSLISGFYPALYLSHFEPIQVLKGNLKTGAKNVIFRKIMVIFQFTLSILLLIFTIYFYKQLNFIQNKKMGFEKENIAYINLDKELLKNYDVLKRELSQIPEIKSITGCSQLPVQIGNSTSSITWPGRDTTMEVLFPFTSVDLNFFETFNMQLVEGRGFSKDFVTDSSNYIINEVAAKMIGKKPIIGEEISLWGQKGVILGVVKNFNFQHLSQPEEPLILFHSIKELQSVVFRFETKNLQETIVRIEKVWKQVNPDFPFEISFLDETFDKMYRMENRIGEIMKYFTIIGVFIACLGLLSLASFMAEQQCKAMIIRKVHGASMIQIFLLMSKEFTRWIIISAIIAFPIAYFGLNEMFKQYAFHTEISFWIFIAAAFGTLLLALSTVSYQSIKTARLNPAEILKYE